jgi:hypothetical protein
VIAGMRKSNYHTKKEKRKIIQLSEVDFNFELFPGKKDFWGFTTGVNISLVKECKEKGQKSQPL